VRRAQALADADDIRSVIMRQAAGFERWAEVTPVMFEDTLATGIEKYAKFVQDIEESGEEQDQILEEIKVHDLV
jgi:programmed cell death 6-interacting protein